MSNNEEFILRDLTKIKKDISELWDSQEKSVEAGLLSTNKNFVILDGVYIFYVPSEKEKKYEFLF